MIFLVVLSSFMKMLAKSGVSCIFYFFGEALRAVVYTFSNFGFCPNRPEIDQNLLAGFGSVCTGRSVRVGGKI